MRWIQVEFHCHTIYSRDCLTKPEALLAACREKGVDKVVVTDHNTIRGGLACRELDPQRVIVGEEVKTQEGELLAAFVKEEVPAGLPAREAIVRLREQGAFISVSHPFDRLRSGHWELKELLAVLPLVDAIETYNSRCFPYRYNRQAERFAEVHGIVGTAGSDAHTAFEVGRARMILPLFESAEELRQVLPRARFSVSPSPLWVRLASRYAYFWKRLRSAT